MTARPRTAIEHEILQLDALQGIFYQSFDDFWEKRMEPMQWISPDAQGALADIRAALRTQAKEQFILFWKNMGSPAHRGSPQAGELHTSRVLTEGALP